MSLHSVWSSHFKPFLLSFGNITQCVITYYLLTSMLILGSSHTVWSSHFKSFFIVFWRHHTVCDHLLFTRFYVDFGVLVLSLFLLSFGVITQCVITCYLLTSMLVLGSSHTVRPSHFKSFLLSFGVITQCVITAFSQSFGCVLVTANSCAYRLFTHLYVFFGASNSQRASYIHSFLCWL